MSASVTRASGFVLAGGRSTRMRTDKALLPKGAGTLVEHVARQVCAAAGNVTIVADPVRYAHLGLTVVADQRPGCGPLGGVVTALDISSHPWNLIVACDMPDVDAHFLGWLLEQARAIPCDCLVPLGPSGPEPLCAVYHLCAAAKLRAALDGNMLKMRDAVRSLDARYIPVADQGRFLNINTPEEWSAHE